MLLTTLIWRDLKVAFSDKQTVLTLILMPIILVAILGFALSGMFGDAAPMVTIKLGVVFDYQVEPVSTYLSQTAAVAVMSPDQLEAFDQSGQAFDFKALFMEDFLGDEGVKRYFQSRTFTESQARQALESGEIDAVILFDQAFYKNLTLNMVTPLKNKAEVKFISTTNGYLKRMIAKQLVEGFTSQMEQMLTIKNLMVSELMASGQGLETELFESIFGDMAQLTGNGIQLNVEENTLKSRKRVTAQAYYAMGMLSMFLLFTAGYGSRLMLEEKDAFTLQRMHVSGISKKVILTGKFVTMYVLGILQLMAMMVFTRLVLGVEWGNMAMILLIASVSIFAVAALGMMISIYTLNAGSYKVANMLEAFIFQVMAFLGGSFIHIDVLPGVFKTIRLFTINGVAFKALLANYQGYQLSYLRNDILILAAMGVVFFSVALYLYEKGGKQHENHDLVKAQKA